MWHFVVEGRERERQEEDKMDNWAREFEDVCGAYAQISKKVSSKAPRDSIQSSFFQLTQRIDFLDRDLDGFRSNPSLYRLCVPLSRSLPLFPSCPLFSRPAGPSRTSTTDKRSSTDSRTRVDRSRTISMVVETFSFLLLSRPVERPRSPIDKTQTWPSCKTMTIL